MFSSLDGSDRYVLANANSIFYNDGNNSTAGLNDYALIQGFNALAGGFWIEGSSNWLGAIASIYPFTNLIARPSGGLLCDRAGSHKWTLTLLATGIGICYLLAYRIDNNWSISLAIAVIAIAPEMGALFS